MAMQKSGFVQALAARPSLSAMPAAQVRIIVALRIAVLASQKKQNPKPYLTKQLGDERAAGYFLYIIKGMSDCWPDPIAVHRPCCCQTSYDEMLLIDLITAVVQGDTGHFHGLLGEMIGRSDRLKLHRSFEHFTSQFAR